MHCSQAHYHCDLKCVVYERVCFIAQVVGERSPVGDEGDCVSVRNTVEYRETVVKQAAGTASVESISAFQSLV